MRIKQEDLPDFIKETLLSIRQGIQDARAKGMQADLPDKVDFEVEIIDAKDALTNLSTSQVNGTRTSDGTKPAVVETTIKTGGGSTTRETAREVAAKKTTVVKADVSDETSTETSVEVLVDNENQTESQTTDRTGGTKETRATTGNQVTNSSGSSAENTTRDKEYS